MLVHAEKRDYGTALLRRISQMEKEYPLSLAQKLILAETGTVEQALSIITGTAVQVRVMSQTGNDVIARDVMLMAGDTSRPLIRAKSRIYCANLPKRIVSKLRQKKGGIGTIIQQERLETFRQIARMGMSKDRPYRVYRILHNGKVAFEIREEILI